jgi:hypothetical protein
MVAARAAADNLRRISKSERPCQVRAAFLIILVGQFRDCSFQKLHAREFRGTGTDTRRIPPGVLEPQLLAKLQQDVFSPEEIDYVFHKREIELSTHLSGSGDRLEAMRRRKVASKLS